MELALDFESHAGRPLPLTPQAQFQGDKAVSVGERAGPPAGSHPLGQSTGERVYGAGAHPHQAPVPRPAGGGNGSGGQGTTAVHTPSGRMASRATDAATLHCGALGHAAASPGIAAKTECHKGRPNRQDGQHQPRDNQTLPGERRSEAQYQSVQNGFPCGAGAAPGRQAGATVPSGGAAELSPDRSGVRPFYPAGQVPSGQAP